MKPRTKKTLIVFSMLRVSSAASSNSPFPIEWKHWRLSFPLPNQPRDGTQNSSPHNLHYNRKLMKESHEPFKFWASLSKALSRRCAALVSNPSWSLFATCFVANLELSQLPLLIPVIIRKHMSRSAVSSPAKLCLHAYFNSRELPVRSSIYTFMRPRINLSDTTISSAPSDFSSPTH
jgi:hypothetical protein